MDDGITWNGISMQQWWQWGGLTRQGKEGMVGSQTGYCSTNQMNNSINAMEIPLHIE
jgi:hypothetical protein